MHPQPRVEEEALLRIGRIREDMGKGGRSSSTGMLIHTCKMQQLQHLRFVILHHNQSELSCRIQMKSHLSTNNMNFKNQKELSRATKRRGRERRATFDTNHYTQPFTKPLKH